MVRDKFSLDGKLPEDALEQEKIRRAEKRAPFERGMDTLEKEMSGKPNLNDIMRRGGSFGSPSPMGQFGRGGMSNMNTPGMAQQQRPEIPKSKTEQIFDKSMVLGAKGSKKAFEVLKELYPLMKTMGQNSQLRKSFLATLSALFGALSLLGLMYVILGWNGGAFFLTMLVGASLSFITWVLDNIIRPREDNNLVDSSQVEDNSYAEDNRFEEPRFEDLDSFILDDTEDGEGVEEDDEITLDDDDMFLGDLDEDEEDEDEEDFEDIGLGAVLAAVNKVPEMSHGFVESSEDGIEASDEKIKDVTEKFEVLDNTLVNRGLLFDSFIDMLDGGIAAFDKEVTHDINSEIALKYSTLLHEAQDAAGQKEDNYVDIISFKERLMVFDLVVSRKNLSKAHIDTFNEELTALISTKDDGSRNKGIYSKMVLAGRKIYITIFKGENHLVYLRDILIKNRDFFTNPKNKIPVCLGYDEKGSAVLTDLYDVESIICCGKPRTGKSVSVKVIVSQMVQFCSPKEVQFYMGDVKEGTSDWAPLQAPHVKRFEASPEGLLNILEYIIEVEAPRRSQIIGSAGSIKAYNKVNQENKLPFIYIVFDELVALSSASEDTIRKEFHKLLKRAITQFPNLGIRLILIPHTIRHDIIDKLASDNIDFKMAVKADNDTVKEVFKLKNTKDFQYSLEQIGEFAVKLPNSTEVKYAHAPVLMSDDLRIPMLFDTQRKIWSSVAPDEVDNSVYVQNSNKKRQQDVLSKTNLTDGVFEEPSWIKDIAGRK